MSGDLRIAACGLLLPNKRSCCVDILKQFFTQLRQETGVRLCDYIYRHDANVPSKWWMCYAKKKFLVCFYSVCVCVCVCVWLDAHILLLGRTSSSSRSWCMSCVQIEKKKAERVKANGKET